MGGWKERERGLTNPKQHLGRRHPSPLGRRNLPRGGSRFYRLACACGRVGGASVCRVGGCFGLFFGGKRGFYLSVDAGYIVSFESNPGCARRCTRADVPKCDALRLMPRGLRDVKDGRSGLGRVRKVPE